MRVGIVGQGSIGQRHMNNLLEMNDIELFGYDRDEDRLQDLPIQSTHKILELWEWKPDSVIICVPPDQHYRVAIQAFTRNCHAFCEKPLATNYADAKRLCEEAHARHKILAVGYQLRFALRSFRDWSTGSSEIQFACSQDMSAWPSQYTKDTLEEFSHEIASAVFCNGPAEAVTAQAYPGKWDIQLRHLQGYSKISLDSLSKNSFRFATASNGATWEFDSRLNDQAYLSEMQRFIAVCQGEPRDEWLCSGAEGAHVVRIIECCRESAQYHSVVNV